MASVLTIDGTPLDPAADDFLWGRLLAHARGQVPTLDFVRKCRPLASLPDPWLNKPVELDIDATLRFAGDIVKVRHRHVGGVGWCHYYRAIGLKARGDHIPVVDDNTHTTTTLFNLPFDDRRALPSRQGRSLGQMIAQVLEGLTNSAALTDAGLVNYTSAGSGASATATIVGGELTGYDDLAGGTGYTTAPTVLVVGGDPTVRATATASVSAGAVTAITITDDGAGYRYLPTFVFSRLPTATITDLTTGILDTLVVPHPVPFSGEKLFVAIEQALRTTAPNHLFHVEPDGTLRFLDIRDFTPATITLNKTGGTAAERRWLMPSLERSVDECYSRVEVWGDSHNEPKLLTLAAGTLYEKFEHSGLDNAQAKAAWKLGDWNDPADPLGRATGNAVRNAGTNQIDSITPQSVGFGYPPSTTVAVTITGGGGTGADFDGDVDADGQITGYTQVSGGSGYTSTPTVTVPSPPDSSGQSSFGTCTMANTVTVEVDPDDDDVAWAADFWDQTPSGRRGVIFLEASTETGFTQQHTSPIIANDALTAAGAADVTLLLPAPHTDFDFYRIVGEGSGTSSIVWRLYGVTDPDVAIAQSTRFSFPVALPNSDGTAAARTTCPTVHVIVDGIERPVGFTIDPDAGTILLGVPSVKLFGTTFNLEAGGDSTDGIPDDILYWASINTGSLRAICPADTGGSSPGPNYEGTSYTVEGLERTLVVTLTDWRDESNRENMELFACEILDSVKDTIVEGEIGYLDLYADALAPGISLIIEGQGYDTPWEALELPVLSAELIWHVEPTGPRYSMTLGLSNRRAQVTGASFWAPGMEMDMYSGGGGFGVDATMLGGEMGFASGVGVAGFDLSGVAPFNAAADAPGLSLDNYNATIAGATTPPAGLPGLSGDAFGDLLRRIREGRF